MKCPHCGQEHSNLSIFCPQTGRRIRIVSTAQDSGFVHEAVDLGIGVKWATCNIGSQKPEDFGYYFSWGETTTKTRYASYDYKYGIEGYYRDQKYTMSIDDSRKRKIVLDLEDDAAHCLWGGNWRMPTEGEFADLINDCVCNLVENNGIMGLLVHSKINNNSIFLPAAGMYHESMFGYGGVTGAYWSSTLFSFYHDTAASYLTFEKVFGKDSIVLGNSARYRGLSIRPVCK